VLTTHADPACVTLQYPIDPNSCTLFTAPKLQLAGELVTVPSYSTVAGVFDDSPKSCISNTTAIGAGTSPPPNVSTAPSTIA
jgi:hypothetical protein